MLIAVVAMSQSGVIGKDNQLPWHLPNDLKHFKALTLNHTVLMGRKTFQSIGRPLPNRTNIVLTRDASWTHEGCIVMHDIDEVLKKFFPTDIFVIGGAEIYRALLPKIDKIYMTQVHADIAGDAAFPQLNSVEWHVSNTEHHHNIPGHTYDFSFLTLDRIPRSR